VVITTVTYWRTCWSGDELLQTAAFDRPGI